MGQDTETTMDMERTGDVRNLKTVFSGSSRCRRRPGFLPHHARPPSSHGACQTNGKHRPSTWFAKGIKMKTCRGRGNFLVDHHYYRRRCLRRRHLHYHYHRHISIAIIIITLVLILLSFLLFTLSSAWLRFGPGQYRLLRCTILLRLLLISLLKSAYTTGLMAEFTM